ncbi:uncharacterized protein FIBRA_09391 [Fibroporia radiculosa]|uniref:Uncharacterized protein n=1 Tax=Fibroporia radiculosa TaxID=599839 RepID=J7SD01_9APHY|nr:uncharacterized protein FIBRA_09391 [Fibroporia radiculosa]CCM07068.1 predicted protein [Fibroporia radiculosa]
MPPFPRPPSRSASGSIPLHLSMSHSPVGAFSSSPARIERAEGEEKLKERGALVAPRWKGHPRTERALPSSTPSATLLRIPPCLFPHA